MTKITSDEVNRACKHKRSRLSTAASSYSGVAAQVQSLPGIHQLAHSRAVRENRFIASFVSRMPMRQVAHCMNKALNERGDRYQQSRKKKHRMDRDAETDCESDQQRCRRWFGSCQQHFSHNASFSSKP
jgi:hypothetical protein